MATYGYLAHHGIKGQKWGIRRYENRDGTLTEEGKRHYGIYKDYKSTGDKFNKMTKMVERSQNYLKDDKFKNEYEKVGNEFEGYLKNNKDSIKIGKKLSKRHGRSPKDINQFVLKSKSTSLLKNNRNANKCYSDFKKSADYKKWYNSGMNDKESQKIAAKYLLDFAGAKLRDMELDDSFESRYYLANKKYFQDSVPGISGYLQSWNYKLLNEVDDYD